MHYAKKLQDFKKRQLAAEEQRSDTPDEGIKSVPDQTRSSPEHRPQLGPSPIEEEEARWLAKTHEIPFIEAILPDQKWSKEDSFAFLSVTGFKPTTPLYNPSQSADAVSTLDQTAEAAFAITMLFEGKDPTFVWSPEVFHYAYKRLADAMAPIFGDTIDVWSVLVISKYQYYKTKNSLWPLMMFGLCIRAGISPPPWVWRYFRDATSMVLAGASPLQLRPAADKILRKQYSDDKLVEQVGLKKVAGNRDKFTNFRQTLADLRLAFMVRRIAFPAADKKKKIPLKDACRFIVNESKRQGKRRTEKETMWDVRQVWKAYHRWFKKDGTLLCSPRRR